MAENFSWFLFVCLNQSFFVLIVEQSSNSVVIKFRMVKFLVILCIIFVCRLEKIFETNLEKKKRTHMMMDQIFMKGKFKEQKLKALDAYFFGTITSIFDAMIEEHCYIEDCPSGATRQPNPDFIPESNGCGSHGFKWRRDLLPDGRLEDCCNVHDYCYDECGADRDLCDLEFKTCLYSVCRSRKDQWTVHELKGVAKLLYTATQAFGCKAYQNAQKQSCHCVATTHHQTHHQEV